jgi:TraB/PrgY/gumN family
MRRVLVLLVALCLLACDSPTDTPVEIEIYSIQKSTGDIVGYILGSTHGHSSPVNVVDLRKRIAGLRPLPSELRTETVTPVDVSTLSGAMLPRGQTVFDYVELEQHDVVRDLFRIFRKYGVDQGWPLEQLHPGMFVPIYLQFSPAPNDAGKDRKDAHSTARASGIDIELEKLAREHLWKQRSIEDSTDLFAALTGGNVGSYANCLLQYGSYLEDRSRWVELDSLKKRRVRAFKQQNAEDSYAAAVDFFKSVITCDDTVALGGLLLRNKAMVEKILRDIRDGQTLALYAPGASHLGGPIGIVSLLREQSYRVEKIPRDARKPPSENG